MIGKTISHYRILEKIGEGGMGIVYLAQDTLLGRKVALKFLPDYLEKDKTARKRFIREARSAAALDHPYICSIHDVGEVEGKSFIVMEYLEGRTLKDRLAQGSIPLKEVMQWAKEITEALVVAHEKGIIHRDLKPANIMLLQTGHAKVMDFGLAKQISPLPQLGSQENTLSGTLTQEGATVGTLPYMSPEQIQGNTLDQRSDLFSMGIVFYEMLTGVNPFKKGSGFDTAEAILRETPDPASNYRSDSPQLLVSLIAKLLAKKPEDRYQNAQDVAEDLQKAFEEKFQKQIVVTRSAFSGVRAVLKKPVYLIPLILVLAAAAYFSVQGIRNYQRSKWARDVAPKEVERLIEQERPIAAARLLKEAELYAPESEDLDRLIMVLLYRNISITTMPAGADIYVSDYADTDENDPSRWELLGRSPFTAMQFPPGYHRFRLVKEGFEPVEFASNYSQTVPIKLHSRNAIPAGMVWVAGFAKGAGTPAAPAGVEEYWIDKYEVTNRQFKEFVDAGGYQKREYWKLPFIKDGRPLSWEEAMSEFRDPTGRPGPATWELGNYPEGKGDYPVGGVSWYEAAAYAEFAGKSLPTVYHWYHANSAEYIILQLSNFSGKGSAEVGTYDGVGSFGTYDTAGNMKEWCWNEVEGDRYILGGAWNEPEYQFANPDARQPFERAETFGFRCIKYEAPLPDILIEPVMHSAFSSPDRRKDKPADDQTFQVYLNLHSYDKTDLKPEVESIDEESSRYWRKERITFQAAYGNERVIADLYLPKDAAPPLQTVMYASGMDTFYSKTFWPTASLFIEFIVRTGRAVMAPHYKYTLERGPMPDTTGRPDLQRQIGLQWSKDFGRSIDYLETRPEIDIGKLAFLGVSFGAYAGPVLIAVEPRIKVAVLAGGGSQAKNPAEVDPWNYAPRVRIPVLMLNGRSDFLFPLETSQKPLFRLLGAPEKDKKHLLYEGGHDIFHRPGFFKDIFDWLDRYLGPVEMNPNR